MRRNWNLPSYESETSEQKHELYISSIFISNISQNSPYMCILLQSTIKSDSGHENKSFCNGKNRPGLFWNASQALNRKTDYEWPFKECNNLWPSQNVPESIVRKRNAKRFPKISKSNSFSGRESLASWQLHDLSSLGGTCGTPSRQ